MFVKFYEKLPEGHLGHFVNIEPELIAVFTPVPKKLLVCETLSKKPLLRAVAFPALNDSFQFHIPPGFISLYRIGKTFQKLDSSSSLTFNIEQINCLSSDINLGEWLKDKNPFIRQCLFEFQRANWLRLVYI